MNEIAMERNRQALKRLLALLFVYIGLADDTRDAMRQTDGPARALRAMADPMNLPRRVHRLILALLIPVEAATRRLIIALAGRLPTPKLRPSEIAPWRVEDPRLVADPLRPDLQLDPDATNCPDTNSEPQPASKPRPPRFALVDPLKCYLPSGSEFPVGGFAADPDKADDPLPDTHLMRRIAALAFALNDLTAQARRFARWKALSRRAGRPSARRAPDAAAPRLAARLAEAQPAEIAPAPARGASGSR